MARHHLESPSGLRSKRFGRPSNYQLPDTVARDAIGIIRELYPDFGPTLACEKLYEVHHLKLAKETVRRLMVDAGLWVPRKQRPPKIYQPRHRRPCIGELIQIDGSDHDWFEGRDPNCTLLIYVDDATSRIMQLLFTKSESTFSYYQATRAYLEKHGKPIALYSDKASVFRINKKQVNGGNGHTQCVSKSLMVQYDKRLLMLGDTAENRKLASRYIEVYHYPDSSIELRANGKSLPYSVYDQLPEVQEGTIVDNKRLGHASRDCQADAG